MQKRVHAFFFIFFSRFVITRVSIYWTITTWTRFSNKWIAIVVPFFVFVLLFTTFSIEYKFIKKNNDGNEKWKWRGIVMREFVLCLSSWTFCY